MKEELKKITIEDLHAEIRLLSEEIAIFKSIMLSQTQTANLNELYAALAKAQAEMQPAEENKDNPYFKSKYADLTSIVMASRSILTKYGISVIQEPISTAEGQIVLQTTIAHSSGQARTSAITINIPKQDINSIEAFISRYKRISYKAIVGVTTSDEDDDGNSCFNPNKSSSDEYINQEELNILRQELQGSQDILDAMLKGLKITSISQLPKQKFNATLTRIGEIKESKKTTK